MTIPLESRAHVLFIYKLIPDIIDNFCVKKLYYYGIKVRVPRGYDIRKAVRILASSIDVGKTIDKLGFRSFHIFTGDRTKALTFRYDEVYKDAKKLESKIIAKMYVQALDEEWTPF